MFSSLPEITKDLDEKMAKKVCFYVCSSRNKTRSENVE